MPDDSTITSLKNALNNLTNLQIITCIGTIKPQSAEMGDDNVINIKWSKFDDKNGYTLLTQINLLQGDIISILPEDINDPAKQWIKDYHLEQASKGMEIISNNFKVFTELAQTVIKLTKELKDTGSN